MGEISKMEDSSGLARSVVLSIAGYPLYLARTLIQLGYEPRQPDEYGRLPNLFTYVTIVKQERGYAALYTGLGYHLAAVVLKKSSYDAMSATTNHKKDIANGGTSEVIAACLRESVFKIYSTLITYPLVTLGIAYISTAFFDAKGTVEYSVGSLYKGLVPKLIIEVTMVWVSIISKRLTVTLIDDEVGQAIVSRVPPFIVQSIMYPLNVVSTVMADNGRSQMNPKFDNWKDCFRFLRANNQLKRGSAFLLRKDYQYLAGSHHAIKRYF